MESSNLLDNELAASPSDQTETKEVQEDPRLVQANKLYQTGVLLIYGKRKSVDKAIKCIQRAITFNDSDYKYWLLLGEAYYQRGNFNPAINCFIKSLNLAESVRSNDDEDTNRRNVSDCTYSRLRMSDIRLSVGHLDQAANGYRDIISQDSNNVAALVGLSKTELQLARNNFSSGLVKLGHIHCMQALKYSLRAVKLCPHLCLTWKLASDCCITQFIHGQRGHFKAVIEEQFPGPSETNEVGRDVLVVDEKTCIELAQQFLCKALDIEPFQDSACLWHNLGISIYLKSTIITLRAVEREALLKRSLKCLLKALDLDRANSQVRNSIGVVTFNLNLLNSAQTFFIKSIQTNLSTSEIQFSNLGYIYLQKGEFRLASVAFNRCQAEEPLYSRAWLGNALVDEQNKVDNISHLRHCQRLENNYESQLMFATKVSSLPLDNESRRDLVNALDCMKRVINYNDQSLEANNTLGLLYERCHHLDQAKSCFEAAYKISPLDSRVIFNKLRQHSAMNTCCHTDIDTNFFKTAEKLVNGGNREYILNFIYYSFINEDYRNVNDKMTKLLDLLPRDDMKSKIAAQILLGLAAKGESRDFKSWLFKNIIDLENANCIEAVINLLSLMLLGAITNDQQLVSKISDDLARHLLFFISTPNNNNAQFVDLFYSSEGYWIRASLMYSIFCLPDESKLIKSILALFPTIAELWLYLGLTLMFRKAKHPVAVFCIKKAKLIGSTSADLVVICDILLSILTELTKTKSHSIDNRMKYLSRATQKYPDCGLLWESLMKLPGRNIHESKPNKKSRFLSEENTGLFHLAIDLILKMIS